MSMALALPDAPSPEQIEKLILKADRSDLAEKTEDQLVSEIDEHVQLSAHHHERYLHHRIEAGRRLIEIKRFHLSHGEFLPFLSDHGISQPSAWRMMHMAAQEDLLVDAPPETSDRAALALIAEKQAAAKKPLAEPALPRPVNLPQTVGLEHADASDLPVNDGFADLIVTSPPYGLGIQYSDTDDDMGYTTYIRDFAPAWAREMYRVLSPQGRLCLNVPIDVSRKGHKPMDADWTHVLLEAGFKYRPKIIWNEGNTNRQHARGSVDSPGAIHVFAPVEAIIVVHKGEWERYVDQPHDLSKPHAGDCDDACSVDTCGHQRWLAWGGGTGMWTFPGESRKFILDTGCKAFPEELARRCIQLFSYRGDIVVDPFVGTGTTAVVAAQLGRAVYGFDHSERYLQFSRERVDRALNNAA